MMRWSWTWTGSGRRAVVINPTCTGGSSVTSHQGLHEFLILLILIMVLVWGVLARVLSILHPTSHPHASHHHRLLLLLVVRRLHRSHPHIATATTDHRHTLIAERLAHSLLLTATHTDVTHATDIHTPTRAYRLLIPKLLAKLLALLLVAHGQSHIHVRVHIHIRVHVWIHVHTGTTSTHTHGLPLALAV